MRLINSLIRTLVFIVLAAAILALLLRCYKHSLTRWPSDVYWDCTIEDSTNSFYLTRVWRRR